MAPRRKQLGVRTGSVRDSSAPPTTGGGQTPIFAFPNALDVARNAAGNGAAGNVTGQQGGGGGVAGGELTTTMELTRKEEIAELPALGISGGMVPVDAGCTILIVPLRNGDAAALYFDEAAKAHGVVEKVAGMRVYLAEKVAKQPDGMTLELSLIHI